MNQTRLEWKVGLFVFGGLALLVVLLLLFSKGFTLEPTYTLRLKVISAGTLKTKSTVQMAGVPVGTISKVELAPDGKSVIISLKLQKKFEVHRDARFVIETSGFLGDQYVAILPGENREPVLREGDTATAQLPFDWQEAARKATGFIEHIDDTAKRLNETIDDIRQKALNPETLTNLSTSVANLREFSENALVAVSNVQALLATNSMPVTTVFANLNIATASLTNLLNDVQSGKGLVGRAIEDPKLAADLAALTANLSATSSNLNRFGLWHVLFKGHAPATNTAAPRKK